MDERLPDAALKQILVGCAIGSRMTQPTPCGNRASLVTGLIWGFFLSLKPPIGSSGERVSAGLAV